MIIVPLSKFHAKRKKIFWTTSDNFARNIQLAELTYCIKNLIATWWFELVFEDFHFGFVHLAHLMLLLFVSVLKMNVLELEVFEPERENARWNIKFTKIDKLSHEY